MESWLVFHGTGFCILGKGTAEVPLPLAGRIPLSFKVPVSYTHLELQAKILEEGFVLLTVVVQKMCIRDRGKNHPVEHAKHKAVCGSVICFLLTLLSEAARHQRVNTDARPDAESNQQLSLIHI